MFQISRQGVVALASTATLLRFTVGCSTSTASAQDVSATNSRHGPCRVGCLRPAVWHLAATLPGVTRLAAAVAAVAAAVSIVL